MNKIIRIIIPIVAVVFGVAVIIGGARKLQSRRLYDASTTAVITGIEREWTGTDGDGFDQYEYHVYVDYEVDGKKYENMEYPGYDSSMKDGDRLEILYQSSDPGNFAEKNVTGNAVLFIAAGAVLSLGGVIAEIRAFVRK